MKIVLAALGLLALIVIVDGAPLIYCPSLFRVWLKLVLFFLVQPELAPTLPPTVVRLFATSSVVSAVSVLASTRSALVTTYAQVLPSRSPLRS
jgi:hypothetical protein